jgi:DNA-binding NarL/FixJ family response regulator
VSVPPTLKILNKIRSRADTRFVGSGTQTISMPSTSTSSVVFERRDARKKPEGRHSFTLPKCALSPRETDVCKLLLEGMQLKEVAFRLNISIRTAECHSRNAYAKLGIHCRGELFKHFAGPNSNEMQDSYVGNISKRLELIEAKLAILLS